MLAQRRFLKVFTTACKLFDDWVERIAGHEYRWTFFTYYTVTLPKIRLQSYTQGLITDQELLQKLARASVTKKLVTELRRAPTAYNSWPADFTFEHDVVLSARRRLELRSSIESCINRRDLFRNKCVIACSKRFDTTGHDMFLLILQTLRAKLMLQLTIRPRMDRWLRVNCIKDGKTGWTLRNLELIYCG